MEELVICPTCKQYGLRSKVFVADWRPFLKKSGGYYNEEGRWEKFDLTPRMMRHFVCSYGHWWIDYD